MTSKFFLFICVDDEISQFGFCFFSPVFDSSITTNTTTLPDRDNDGLPDVFEDRLNRGDVHPHDVGIFFFFFLFLFFPFECFVLVFIIVTS